MRIINGDATSPQAAGLKVIAHVCNDLGGWGRGFVTAISRRWPEPERDYRAWHRDRARNDFGLGAIRIVPVRPDILVANMVGQHGIRASGRGVPPVRYDAIERCLTTLAGSLPAGASVHMPRIGCGLAGGSWDKVGPIVERTLCARGIPVTVYDHR